jgi:hypothetical protein
MMSGIDGIRRILVRDFTLPLFLLFHKGSPGFALFDYIHRKGFMYCYLLQE